jgi:DNA-binding response OmpR family regulator
MPQQTGHSAELTTDRAQTQLLPRCHPVTEPDLPSPADGPDQDAVGNAAPAVILVEGDAALAEMLEYSVRNTGHSVRTFKHGELAIEFLLDGFPSHERPVVLLDLDLLGTEGFSALQQIVNVRPGLRSIVLSAQGAERDQIRAIRAGAMDYLVKPLSIPVLIAKVERLLDDSDR